MKVKFDKAVLLKHRFWILSSVAAVLTLVGISYLVLYGSDEATKQRAKLKTLINLAKGTEAKNNRDSIEEIAKQAKTAQEAAAKVWAKAYQDQAEDFVWPAKIEKEYNFLSGLFASDIKIGKATDKKEAKDWPADTEFVMHGMLIEGQAEWARIMRRRKVEKFDNSDKTDKAAKDHKDPKDDPLEEVKIFRMEPTPTITLTGEENKALIWEDFITQPKDKLLTISYQTGKYFGDHLTDGEKRLFKDSYKEQIDDILRMVDPVDETGAGIVQLRNWPYRRGALPVAGNKFFRYVAMDWDVNQVTTPKFSAEAWIAQENIWIQREVYRLIKAANDDISNFRRKRQESDGKIVEWPLGKKAKDFDQEMVDGVKRNYAYRFQNVNFEINLTLQADNKLKFKIINLQPRKQKLDLRFRIVMNEQMKHIRFDRTKSDLDQSVFRISDDALMPSGDKGGGDSAEKTIDYVKEKELDRTGIFGVEQVLTWETAAIKRIDNLSIGSNDGAEIAHSHREFANLLRSFEDKPEPKAGADKKEEPGGIGKPPPGGEKREIGGGGGGVGNKTMLHHGLWTDRYEDVTMQSRRLPVAVVLIVDQDHVNRVLTHFNNSKFRYLHSQVTLNHYTGSLQPNITVEQKKGGSGPEGVLGGTMGGNQGAAGGGGGGQEHETNMEIIIYGVMTLYQRFPPRPGADKKP